MWLWFGAATAAFVVGSFVEYWGHRSMHVWLKRARHVEHHQSGTGQGFCREFWGYARGAWPMFPAGFVHSSAAGVGFAAGALGYCAFAAYAHVLQHVHPECCFWLCQPLHHVHHTDKLWHHNFGITFDVWDRVFGTYRRVVCQAPTPRAWRNLLRIKWVVRSAARSPELLR
jgi:sterol desaturase/sphingolipid hydroxylase (fatty acid hydroxylase superfamily)